jgi:hypothetical protein
MEDERPWSLRSARDGEYRGKVHGYRIHRGCTRHVSAAIERPARSAAVLERVTRWARPVHTPKQIIRKLREVNA